MTRQSLMQAGSIAVLLVLLVAMYFMPDFYHDRQEAHVDFIDATPCEVGYEVCMAERDAQRLFLPLAPDLSSRIRRFI